jgi:broad specificity phosphatase PhoE
MALRLLLVRHGETIWNHQRRCQGFSDIPLSAAGEEQAKNLARALKPVPLDAVISSDLVRAKRTAEFIAEPHQIMIKTDARFRELNQGQLEGKNITEMLADHPALLKQWMENPADTVMPEGESLSKLQARASSAINEIAANYPDHTVAVVSHNLCILTIVCKIINLNLNDFRRLRIDNASVSEIEFSSRGPILNRINDIHHLKT